MDILEKCPLYQNKHIIKRILDKTNYNIMTYNEIFIDDTRKVKKIKKGDYLASGRYPIIDQGQEYVGGYTDENEGIYNDIPFIIFGDHTRIIKYIEEPSFIGADGVKVLNIKDDMVGNIDIRYVYYYLLYSTIPNDGYSRHFKYVKNQLYVIPSIKIQKQIVEVLDEAQKLIDNRKEQLKLLDDLIESIFYDMFGDPVKNDKGWEVKKLGKLGELGRGKSKHRPRNDISLYGGEYPFIQTGDVSNSGLYLEKFESTYSERGLEQSKMWPKNTLCITIAANIAKTTILKIDACFPDSIVGFISNENSNVVYIRTWFLFFQEIIEKAAPQSAQKNINLRILNDLDVIAPPIQLQNQFAEKVELIEKQKSLLEQSLKLLEDNYNNLMQRAFKGELF